MDIQIQLKQIRITDLDYRSETFNQMVSVPLNTQMGLKIGLNEKSKNAFFIIFEIKLEDEHKTFFLALKANAAFETNDELDDTFVNSPFARINAPAIAFPYLRTFISNFTLNSGISPIILPSFNFVKLAEGITK